MSYTLPMLIRLGFLILIATRLVILFGYSAYITDVSLYFDQAGKAAMGLKTYTDFFYPYPPLSLALIYFPNLFGASDFWTYRGIFTKELFALDLLVAALMVWGARKQWKWSEQKIFTALCFYSAFGLLQGHLLYDRIDLGISLFVLSMVFLPKHLIAASNFGMLFKIVPPIPAAFFLALQQRGKNFWIRLPALILPSIAVILLIECTTNPGILKYLFEHQQRGIQIESVWATPFMLSHASITTNYGAQHLVDNTVPALYLMLSKYLGWLALGALGLFTLTRAPKKPSQRLLLLTPLMVLIVFLCTQRVLSPQFFIWLIPFLSLACAEFKSPALWGLSFGVYTLTYIGFDIGYWEFVKLSPFFVNAVALRNLLLVALTVWIVRRWIFTLRST